MDRRPLGRRAGSGPSRACPIRRDVEGGQPSATEPQWRRINRSWAAVYERVIRASSGKSAPAPRRLRRCRPRHYPLRSLVTRAASRRRSPGARRSPVTGAASRDGGGPAERFHLPTGVHRRRARRGPALGYASEWARFAVAGRACGLCGQLIRASAAMRGVLAIITV